MIDALTTLCTTKLIPLIAAFVGFGILITVHEFGHYFFAKLFNVHTPIFSIGFGPALIKKKIGTTQFRLSPLPLGGYCMIDGGAEAELNMPHGMKRPADEDTFPEKPYWQKFFIMFGGIMFNLLFTYGVFTFLSLGTIQKVGVEPTISNITAESPAYTHGIKPHDILRGFSVDQTAPEYGTIAQTMNGKSTLMFESMDNAPLDLRLFLSIIAQLPGKEMTLHLERDGLPLDKIVTLGRSGTVGTLGIGIDIVSRPIEGSYEYNSLPQAINKGIEKTNRWISQTARSLMRIFTRKSLDGMGGPVALLSQSFRVAKNGFNAFLSLLAIISISLALINLVPFGPLDGSQIAIVTIEALIRRPLPERFKEGIALVGWLVLMSLILFLSYRDILRLFGL